MKVLYPLIKWSGSKRSQAERIISFFPKIIETYYEPFLGSGSVLGAFSHKKAICGDICDPLIQLWRLTQKKPLLVAEEYRKRWSKLQRRKYLYFYEVRDEFNRNKSPHDFLFLSRTCVNGLIRFNKNGEFNNSFHHSRQGINPKTLKKIILSWSSIIKFYHFRAEDYASLTRDAKKGDFIYLDPPYCNTKGRYFGTIDLKRFIKYLGDLNKRKVKFALSFDGKRGEKSFLVKIPKSLYKKHLLIHSGNASFNKIQNGKIESVYESLYLNY